MPVHRVSSIDAPDFGAMTVRVGDLNGDGAPDLLFVQSVYDGDGNIVDEVEVPAAYCGTYRDPTLKQDNPGIHYCCRADVWGDSREEIILAGWKGLCIYANAGAFSPPALYNSTVYRGA